MKGRNSVTITIRVPDSVHQLLEAKAKALDCSVHQLIKRKVEDYALKLVAESHSVHTTTTNPTRQRKQEELQASTTPKTHQPTPKEQKDWLDFKKSQQEP